MNSILIELFVTPVFTISLVCFYFFIKIHEMSTVNARGIFILMNPLRAFACWGRLNVGMESGLELLIVMRIWEKLKLTQKFDSFVSTAIN